MAVMATMLPVRRPLGEWPLFARIPAIVSRSLRVGKWSVSMHRAAWAAVMHRVGFAVAPA
jgi:hypothetical protein